jgi:hypothetical protein
MTLDAGMGPRLLLLSVLVVAVGVALLAPASAGAQDARCPPGQSGTPPYCEDVPPTVIFRAEGQVTLAPGFIPPTSFRFRIRGRVAVTNGRSLFIEVGGCTLNHFLCRFGVRARAGQRVTTQAAQRRRAVIRRGNLIASKSVLLPRERVRSDIARAEIPLVPGARRAVRQRKLKRISVRVGGRDLFGNRNSVTKRMRLVYRPGAKPRKGG